MKKPFTVILQIIVVLVGIGVLAFLLVEPHFEGRNTHAVFWQVYLHDPFLMYAYLASIPFFVGLYQVSLILQNMGNNALQSPDTKHALQIIRYCAGLSTLCIIGGAAWLLRAESDDRPSIVMLATLAVLACGAVFTLAGKWLRNIKK